MAQSSPTLLSGADRIRALTDEDSIFHAFDSYPWKKDKTFMSGLHAILGDPDNPQGSLDDMATHARIFYYAQALGVSIDFSRYQAWRARNPDRAPPDVLPSEYLARGQQQQQQQQVASSTTPTSWQQAAPKADLYVDKKARAAEAAESAAQAGVNEPAYPMQFAEMIKLLQEGKEVPGIRQIPNTILRDPSVKPVGSRTVPRKPWERGDATSSSATSTPQDLDSEFPPIDIVPGSSS